MARVNINILGISELKWMGEFNSDDHYIYYCGPKYLRRYEVVLLVSKRVRNAVQFSSVAQSFPTLCGPMDCSILGFPVHPHSWSLLKLMSIVSTMPSNHLTLCHPFLLLPSNFP